MILLDVNILLHAYNPQSPEHAVVGPWLEKLLSSEEIALPWVTLWGFVRIVTNPRLWARAASVESALGVVEVLISRPNVSVVEPGPRHLGILAEMMRDGQSAGTRTTDAVLAALAIERGATLASTDMDFSRFAKLKWVNPLG